MAVVRAAANVNDDGKEAIKVVDGGRVVRKVRKFQFAGEDDPMIQLLQTPDRFDVFEAFEVDRQDRRRSACLLYTSPSPRDA